MQAKSSSRVFKTAWFSKAAKRVRIGDVELCIAIRQVMKDQADDLGGGVFKKLAHEYAGNTEDQLAVQLGNSDLTEICNDEQGKVQE